MKYRIELILLGIVSIVAAYVILVEVDNYFNGQLSDISQQNPDTRRSIQGFSFSDELGNSRQYTLSQIDEISCEDFMPIWSPEFLELNEADLLNEKMSSCIQQNDGYFITSEKIHSGSIIFD